MTEKKEEISNKKNSENYTDNEFDIDNYALTIEELIVRMQLLSKTKKPYTVSKEVEEIKSIFYKKITSEQDADLIKKTERKETHPLELRFKSAFNTYKKNKQEFRKLKQDEEIKNLKIKEKIIQDISTLKKEKESIKITFEKFHDIQKKWRKTGHVPIAKNNHIWQSYHHQVELFYDFIKINKDLRDIDFKRNLEAKTEICSQAEKILKENSATKMHNDLQELHQKWRNIGPVAKEAREIIWGRFQKTTKEINKTINEYYLEKKEKDSKKLEKKNLISQKIKNLITENQSHQEWKSTSIICSKLESEWRSLGKLSKNKNKIAWKKLREALNKFYSSKKLYYKAKKQERKETLEKKLIICKKAEELQNNTNWKETSEKIIKLQLEWKKIDFSPEKQSNKIWKRFKNACNHFLKAKKNYYKSVENEQKKMHQAKQKLLKQVKDFKKSSNSKKDIKKLSDFNLSWQKIVKTSKNKKNINEEFYAVINSKFNSLGIDEKLQEKEKYKIKITSIQGNKQAIKLEKDFIKKQIDSIKKEILQYENNISFFVKGDNTENLKKKIRNNIKTAKENIEQLERKIELLNKV